MWYLDGAAGLFSAYAEVFPKTVHIWLKLGLLFSAYAEVFLWIERENNF